MTTDNDNPTARKSEPAATQPTSVHPNGDPSAASEGGADPIAELRGERDKFKEQLMRTAADFDNFRKRSRRDVDDARQRGRDELIRDLLPVFDNLERAVQLGTGAGDANSVLEGVRMVLKLFEDTTERLGLAKIKSVGERFDPAMHEALQQQESNEHAPGTIVAEVAPGYRFGDRLVRPAMVIVARKPADAKSAHAPDTVPIQSGSDGQAS